MDSDQCRDQVLDKDNILDFCHLQNTSLETPNDEIYFENHFGFQDEAFGFQDEVNWLVIDNTIAMLSPLILIKKLLQFLRYLHLNISSGNHLKFTELLLIMSKTWTFVWAIDT